MTKKNVNRFYIEGQEYKEKGYLVHLDHKLSIREAYLQGIRPEVVAEPSNLCYVLPGYNLSKGSKSSTTFRELMEEMADFDEE